MNQGGGNQFRRGQKRPAEYDEGEGEISSKAFKIMRMMGYQSGTGLGKAGQGIVEPIQPTQRKGRRGLGHEPQHIDPVPESLDWDINEVVEIEETIEWIPDSESIQNSPNYETLKTWLLVDKKKLIIDDETHFVDSTILHWILKCKSALDEITDNDLFRARSRSNPYEMIKKGIFMNRAAMKMANMDARLQFQITNPKTLDGEDIVKGTDLLYFADICAGPGGFSEYILWRKKWLAKGFGFTLKGECDFKLGDFIAGPVESFEAHYGKENDGDIYNPENCQSFMDYVLKQTNNLGLHFVMADGGFSVKGQENIQEILSRQLYLSQAMVALGIIREGGHFICKLFDVFTPFSVGLVYLMRFCFHKVSLFKPITSRPANSERYLICKWRKKDVSSVFDYLNDCHKKMWNWTCMKEDKDILEIVPLQILKDVNDPFFTYIKEGNDETGKKQIQNLRKIVNYWADPSLKEGRQWDIKNECLRHWGFEPNEIRKRIFQVSPDDKFRDVLRLTNFTDGHYNDVHKTCDRDVTSALMKQECRSPYNWEICVVENTKLKKHRGFFLSAGGSKIYRYDEVRKAWTLVDHFQRFEIPDDTLIYGEIVIEYVGTFPHQTKTPTFHIIDGMVLGGIDIRRKSLTDRNRWCQSFAKALTKSYAVSSLGAFRAKELIPLHNFRQLHNTLKNTVITGTGKAERLVCPVNIEYEDGETETPFIQPGGILFLQEIKIPWLKTYSKSNQRMYYFDFKRNDRTFDLPPDACSDFFLTMQNRLFWEWDKFVDLSYPKSSDDSEVDRMHVDDIVNYIDKIQTGGVK